MTKRILFSLFVSIFAFTASAQQQIVEAKQLKAADSIKIKDSWVKKVVKDTTLVGSTDRDIPTATAVKGYTDNRLLYKVNTDGAYLDPLWISSLAWAKITSTPTTKAGYGITDVPAYSDSTSWLAGRWLPNRSADTASALQARIQTKQPLGSYLVAGNNLADVTNIATARINLGLANGALFDTSTIQPRFDLKEPSIIAGTTAQYWRGDKSWQTLNSTSVGLGNVDNKSSITIRSEITYSNVTSALAFTPENIANKGIANGYADLDALGKIPASRIDFGQTGQTFVVASQAAMLAVSNANIGALAIRTDENKNYRLIAQTASTLANWQVLLSPDAPVQSVNGFTGNVNLITTHINEGSNYYWTAARSRAGQSITTTGGAGAATYDNTTGVLNIPVYQAAGTYLTNFSFTNSTGITGTVTNPTTTPSLGLSIDSAAIANFHVKVRSLFSAGSGISITNGTIASTITQYTDALARAAISGSTGISYNSTTGVITNTITQYTDALARASLSFTAGSGAYNNTTGVITIPTDNSQIANSAGYITAGQSYYIGTTLNALNRTSAAQTLTGVNIDGNAGTATNVYQNMNPVSSTYRILLGNGTNAYDIVYNYSTLYWNQATSTIQGANVSGTSANVTGIVAVANGGTGSGTQNFVDLTTTQTIAGVKTFSALINSTASNEFITNNSSTTGSSTIRIANTGGNMYFGINNSMGGNIVTTSPNATYILNRTATDIVFITNEIARQTINGTTGATNFSSTISASNLSGTNTGDETTSRINALYGYTPANGALYLPLTAGSGNTLTGSLFISKDNAVADMRPATLTNAVYSYYGNQSGSLVVGINNSTGTTLMTGGTAYAASFYTNDVADLQFGTASIVRLTINASAATFAVPVSAGSNSITAGAINGTTGTFSGSVSSAGGLWQQNQLTQYVSAGGSNVAWAWQLSDLASGDMSLSSGTTATGGTFTRRMNITNAGAATFLGSITASSFIKSGGTSSQFLKADGSVDANTYLTTTSASLYSGEYTPTTGTDSTNCSYSSDGTLTYSRNGNALIISGSFKINPVGAGDFFYAIGLPAGWTITAGAGVANTGNSTAGNVIMKLYTSSTIGIHGYATSAGIRTFFFTAQYTATGL